MHRYTGMFVSAPSSFNFDCFLSSQFFLLSLFRTQYFQPGYFRLPTLLVGKAFPIGSASCTAYVIGFSLEGLILGSS